MADLPVSPASSACAAVARPAANSPARGAAARDPAAQAEDKPFQAVLAQELGLLPGARALPGQDMPSAAAKPDSGLKPGDEAAQTVAAGDTPLLPACGGVTLFPPALAHASFAAASTNGSLKPGEDAAQSAALADTSPSPAGAGAIPFPPAFARASVSPQTIAGVSPLPTGYTPAGSGRAALDPRQNRLAKESAAVNAESQLSATPAAADLAVPGKFVPSAEGEIRREAALDTIQAEQHKVVQSPAAAIHAGVGVPAEVTHLPVATLEARVGERGWDQGLGDKLVWMAGQKQQVAELYLNPPELGPLKITLTLNHDQANAQFVCAHAPVREAIEAAMPQLREMLAESGITLGSASVSTDAFREQAQPQHEPRAYLAPPAEAAADPGTVSRGERLLRQSHGLVDTFA